MRLGGNKAVLLVITEHIEMKLLSSEERCVSVKTKEKLDQNKFQQRSRHLEHPLASDSEEDEELEVQTESRQQPKQNPSDQEESLYCPQIMNLTDDLNIEMESFPPFRLSDIELVEIKSTDSSIVTALSSDKTSPMKWKRLNPPKPGLVVKDVICLTRELYMAQLEGKISPRSKRHSALAATELTARITIDSSWSAAQMENRLALLFHKQFKEKTGQRFSFTYLQSVPGSRVLFVPNTPEEGWTGEHVLRICGHGSLYILSHHNILQEEIQGLSSEITMTKRKKVYSKIIENNKSLLVKQICKTPEKLTLDLDTILKLFRAENMTKGVKTHVVVTRKDVLSCALKEVKKSGFCFTSTPIISFDEEEHDSPEEALGEFFRSVLLELQQSCVFEGHPGSLFLTHDLTALDDRKYYEAGVLIGWSLTHGGPGPHLHPALYQLMCCQNPSLKNFSWRDIVDAEAQKRLQEAILEMLTFEEELYFYALVPFSSALPLQLHSCSDVRQLSPTLCDWVSHCGIPGIHSACSYEISTIYARLVKHCIYHRVASMISQFIEGMNSCGGLWDLVKCHWEVFLPVMTGKVLRPLTLEEFRELFTFCYSHPDSELRAEEEATVTHWETVLTFVSDGRTDFSFEDLLLFITGADHLPPLGLPKLISLHFYTLDANTSSVKLPHSSAGALELFLPRGVEEALDLLMLLNRALQNALNSRTNKY